MAKIIKRKLTADNGDLRRWCIEQALRWPVYEDRNYSGAAGGMQWHGNTSRSEADIIGRAEKLLKWVSV
jgi:hypothetical protein